jgi:hypothetical protein
MTANSPTPVSCVFRLGFTPVALDPLGQLEERRPMYSPRISEDLIQPLYRIAKHEGKPMTRLVDEILRPEIERRVQQIDQQAIHSPGPNTVSEGEGPYQPKKNFIRTVT